MFLLRPPYVLRREAFFERKHAYKNQEDGVRTGCATIVKHCAVEEYLLRMVWICYGVVFLVRPGPLGI